MTRNCANCKTPIRGHVLVINERDFHRKTCYCWFAGHRLQGDNKKPSPCATCEPKQGSKPTKPQNAVKAKKRGRPGRAIMVVTR